MAFAGPDVEVLRPVIPARGPRETGPDRTAPRGPPGSRYDDFEGVRRGAADVGLRLHRGRGVDVADDDRAGMFGLPGSQLIGGDRVGQRAAGPLVGDQHGLVRAEDLRGLGHEVHAAEHDGVFGCLSGHPGQRQRITDMVGDILDRRDLVVVRQDRGAPLIGQAAWLPRPIPLSSSKKKTGRTGDDSVGQIVSGNTVQNRHRRLRPGFPLI